MMKYSEFLNESDRYKSMEKEIILELIQKDCKLAWKQYKNFGTTGIYRGANTQFDYVNLEKSTTTRISLSSNYLLNALFHDSTMKKAHTQSRYNSIFCSNNHEHASAFGHVMMCFPLDKSWFTCLPDDFIYTEIADLFQNLLENSDDILDNTDLDSKLISDMNVLSEYYGLKNYNSIKFKESKPSAIIKDANAWIDKMLKGIPDDVLVEYSTTSLIDWTHFTDLRDYFQVQDDSFYNLKTKDVFTTAYQEIWTEDSMYMISYDEDEDFIN